MSHPGHLANMTGWIVLFAALVGIVHGRIGIELEGTIQVQYARRTTTRRGFKTTYTYTDWQMPKPKKTPLEFIAAGTMAANNKWGVKVDFDVTSADQNSHFELVSYPPVGNKTLFMGQATLMSAVWGGLYKPFGGESNVKKWCQKQRGQPYLNTSIALAGDISRLVRKFPSTTSYSTTGGIRKLNTGLPLDHFTYNKHDNYSAAYIGITRYDCMFLDAIEPQATVAIKLSKLARMFRVFGTDGTYMCNGGFGATCGTLGNAADTSNETLGTLDPSCQTEATRGFLALVHYTIMGTNAIKRDSENAKNAFSPLLQRTRMSWVFSQLPAACKLAIRANLDDWVSKVMAPLIGRVTGNATGDMFPEGVKIKVKLNGGAAPYGDKYLATTFSRKDYIKAFSRANNPEDLVQSYRADVTDVPNHKEDEGEIHPSMAAMFDGTAEDQVDGEPSVVVEARKMRSVAPAHIVPWASNVYDFFDHINKGTGGNLAEAYKRFIPPPRPPNFLRRVQLRVRAALAPRQNNNNN